jgi:hypothetical protein
MLTGGVRIDFWVREDWNHPNIEKIIIVIFVVGFVSLLLG